MNRISLEGELCGWIEKDVGLLNAASIYDGIKFTSIAVAIRDALHEIGISQGKRIRLLLEEVKD